MEKSVSSTTTKGTLEGFHLVQLSPDEVSRKWGEISPSIEAALPPIADYEDPARMANVLKAIVGGRLECWALYNKEELWAIGTFEVWQDSMSGAKSLLIYSTYSYHPVTPEVWHWLIIEVRKYAKSMGCRKVVAYSNRDYVVKLFTAFGGDPSYHFLQVEV